MIHKSASCIVGYVLDMVPAICASAGKPRIEFSRMEMSDMRARLETAIANELTGCFDFVPGKHGYVMIQKGRVSVHAHSITASSPMSL